MTAAFDEIGLTVAFWVSDLHFYPKVIDLLFGKPPRFIARLDVSFSERKAL